MPAARPTIIDTDPGIDDAIAILFALRSDSFDLRGLTTVAGNVPVETTTRNALSLLAIAGRTDVPVHRGATGPLHRSPLWANEVHGRDGMGGVELPAPHGSARADAVAWMAATLMVEPPGSLDMLALGPLTNLAQLVLTAPEAARRIGRLIAMGGAWREPGNVSPRAEFNFAADPEAARIVVSAGLPMTLIPLDATRKFRATRADAHALSAAGTAEAKLSGNLITAYFEATEGRDSRPLHDPCVMLMAEGTAFVTERVSVDVELAGTDHGALCDGSSEVEMALDLDRGAAMTRLTAVLSGAAP